MNVPPYMPPDLPEDLSPEDLLEAYTTAESWANGAYAAGQMKAWEARRDELRVMILSRMT